MLGDLFWSVLHPVETGAAVGGALTAKKPNQQMREDRNRIMSSSTKDKIKGASKQAMGKMKEETGKAIGNPDLADRGTSEKVEGTVERKVGEVKKVFGK